MGVNLPASLQNLDPGLRLGDIKGLADAIGTGGGFTSKGAITASTTQTQAAGTALGYGFNHVTVAASADAVKMPKAVPGTMLILVNTSGQSISLFPTSGDKINAAATDAAVSVANVTTSIYICNVSSTQWWGGAITNET